MVCFPQENIVFLSQEHCIFLLRILCLSVRTLCFSRMKLQMYNKRKNIPNDIARKYVRKKIIKIFGCLTEKSYLCTRF